MARITVEDCLTQENNRFALVLLSAKRTKQILQGSKLLITQNKNNKAVVSSLREIADGQVRFMTSEEIAEAKAQELLEAEERTREAFARLSQPVVETEGPSANGENGSNGTPKKVVDEDSDDGEI